MAPKKQQKVISLRDSVKGAVVQILEDEHMECLKTQDGLVTLINALSHYTEEGKALFPVVFVFDSLSAVLAMIPDSEHVCIDRGPRTPETMTHALKKCAPLARSGWAIYIERCPNEFAYGVFRSGANIVSVGLTQTLIESGSPEVPVLMLHQVGANLIEVKGVHESSLLVHFGASRESDASPIPAIDRFVDKLVSYAPIGVKEQAATFYRDLLLEVLRAAHGTLATVISTRRKGLPAQFSDAIALQPAIDVCTKISDLLTKDGNRSDTQLRACGSLIQGMLLSDGITVFAADGSVRAYSVFAKHPRLGSAKAAAGGARQRTFQVLSSLVGKTLKAAFMQSQDGRVETHTEDDK